jgi:DNA-binding PadR family transcriptional regulator
MGKKFISRSEEYILLAILQLQGEAYGVAIRHYLKKITGKTWAFGAIHVMLSRLEKKKLLESFLADPTPQRGGRSKRIYQVTSAGMETLEQIKKIQDKVWSGISEILTAK